MIEFSWPAGERKKIVQAIQVPAEIMQDMRPVFKIVVPNFRQRHSVTFRRMVDPITRKPWAALSEAYAEIKEKKFPGKRILEATGTLRRAATKKGARGNITEMKKQSLVWGVDGLGVYPIVHQATERNRKDGVPIRRGWLGIRSKDMAFIFWAAIEEVYKKKFKRIRGARVRA